MTVDGKEITEISTKSYRELIAPVLQEPFMFRGTVYENIKFAKSDAGKDEINEIVEKFAPRKAKSLRLIDEIGDSEAALEDMSRAYGTGKKTRTFGPRRSLVSRVIGMDFFTSMRDSIMEMFLSEY